MREGRNAKLVSAKVTLMPQGKVADSLLKLKDIGGKNSHLAIDTRNLHNISW